MTRRSKSQSEVQQLATDNSNESSRMTMWHFAENRLYLENGNVVDFPIAIRECKEINDVFVVVLDVPNAVPRPSMTENVYGVGRTGQLLWQIERRREMSSDPQNYYVGVLDSVLPGQVCLGNWNGTAVDVDVRTGMILDSRITK